MKNSLDFRMPVVKAYSYRSKLFHERMIENIFRTNLNKLAYTFTDESQKEEIRFKSSNFESEEEVVKKIEIRKNCKYDKIS